MAMLLASVDTAVTGSYSLVQHKLIIPPVFTACFFLTQAETRQLHSPQVANDIIAGTRCTFVLVLAFLTKLENFKGWQHMSPLF